jgi:uridine phosphorylase
MGVLCFRDRKSSDGLVQALGAEPLGQNVFYGQEAFAESPFVYEATLEGTKMGVMTRCIWGGPQIAILVEELAYLGVKCLIGYGLAGSIDPSLQLGQQVIASAAIPNDGVSRAYNQKERIAADPSLETLAIQAITSLPCEFNRVTVATVDALYRETEEAVAGWREQGAQIINMETSPFYSASKACAVKSIWIGHISDRLIDKWEDWHWKRDEPTRLNERICVELARLVVSSGL